MVIIDDATEYVQQKHSEEAEWMPVINGRSKIRMDGLRLTAWRVMIPESSEMSRPSSVRGILDISDAPGKG